MRKFLSQLYELVKYVDNTIEKFHDHEILRSIAHCQNTSTCTHSHTLTYTQTHNLNYINASLQLNET